MRDYVTMIPYLYDYRSTRILGIYNLSGEREQRRE